jgi:hypothetical protein
MAYQDSTDVDIHEMDGDLARLCVQDMFGLKVFGNDHLGMLDNSNLPHHFRYGMTDFYALREDCKENVAPPPPHVEDDDEVFANELILPEFDGIVLPPPAPSSIASNTEDEDFIPNQASTPINEVVDDGIAQLQSLLQQLVNNTREHPEFPHFRDDVASVRVQIDQWLASTDRDLSSYDLVPPSPPTYYITPPASPLPDIDLEQYHRFETFQDFLDYLDDTTPDVD